MLLQELGFETRHQPLGKLAYVSAPPCEALPLVQIEESELSSHIGRGIGASEVEVRDGCGPGVDVCRKQAWPAHQAVDEGALACLDLPYDGDAAGLSCQQAERVVDEGSASKGRR